MKKRLTLLSIITILLVQSLSLAPKPVRAQDDGAVNSSQTGLCLPGESDLFAARDCLMAGPAQRLEELAEDGITFPPAPLYVANPPTSLANIPFSYAKVVQGEVPLYDSPEDAAANHSNGKLPAGQTKYVSLYNKTADGLFYQIANQKWLSKEYFSKVGVQFFQGYLFNENPTLAFGWILDETVSRVAPAMSAAETGKQYYRYNVVRVYDSVMENQVEWVKIGPDEWIDHSDISRVIPNYEKPEGVETERWIEVNLYEQVLIVHEGDRIVYATLVTTGSKPFYTQPGVFKIYKKIENEYMRGAFEADRSDYYYLEDVPYIMYYDQARALHGAYWHTHFGFKASHGCVNLSIADSHWLYDWATMDETVYVWDPSGLTPTDPSFYGAGGF